MARYHEVEGGVCRTQESSKLRGKLGNRRNRFGALETSRVVLVCENTTESLVRTDRVR